MTNENASPVSQALRLLSEGAYFLPNSVREMLTDINKAPLALLQPWKTKKTPTWFVFECPKEEIKHIKDTLDIDVTHIFVSTRFIKSDMRDMLFNYYVGTCDTENGKWRWLDPSANPEKKPKLSSRAQGIMLNHWNTPEERMRSSWWS